MNIMNRGEFEKKDVLKTYQSMVQAELDSGRALSEQEARNRVELTIFSERIGQFTEADLTQDADGSWTTFEKKIWSVFPELPDDDSFRAMKAGVSMHLCGL